MKLTKYLLQDLRENSKNRRLNPSKLTSTSSVCVRVVLLIAVLMLAVFTVVQADEPVFDAPSFEPVITLTQSGLTTRQAGQTLTGNIDGATYRIRVPENWNQQTLLVYAHGYAQVGAAKTAATTPGGADMEAQLLAEGYALAGSSYRANGWAVQEGISDTLALTRFFSQTVGPPKQTVLWGTSMGSVIVFKSIEDYPEVYDGGLGLCAVGAGASRTWDAALAFALAYDVTFGWPETWGSVADVRDDINFNNDVAPTLFSQGLNPANTGKLEFIRLVAGLPSNGFLTTVQAGDGTPWFGTDMFFTTAVRAELEGRVGGPIVQNVDHVYRLSDDDKTYLTGLGVDAAELLAQMNARTTITATESARTYLAQYADYSGNITRPVLTMHTDEDGFVPAYHETVYQESVTAAGQADLLYQTYVDAAGHCSFTDKQLLAAIAAMTSWLETGNRPTQTDFTAEGFLTAHQPGSWPITFEAASATTVYLPFIRR